MVVFQWKIRRSRKVPRAQAADVRRQSQTPLAAEKPLVAWYMNGINLLVLLATLAGLAFAIITWRFSVHETRRSNELARESNLLAEKDYDLNLKTFCRSKVRVETASAFKWSTEI